MTSITSEHIHFSQTLLSSLPVADPTSSSSPSPSSTWDSGSSNPSGLFSTAGSPALVLAFLAIGIFAGGLISMLFLRRMGIMRLMRQRQLAEAEAAGGTPLVLGRRSRRRAFGDKPKLWEFEHHAGVRNGRGWNRVMPISVKSLQPLSHPLPSVSAAQSPAQQPTHPGVLARWFNRRPPPHPPSPSPPSSLPGRLHVAVAIAMPMRHTQSARPQNPAVPLFELGLIDIPWDAEKFSSLNVAAPIPMSPPSSPTEARSE